MIPGSAARGCVVAFGRLSKSRGGAPRGERIPLDALPRRSADGLRRWRELSAMRGQRMVRLSALRLPSLDWEVLHHVLLRMI